MVFIDGKQILITSIDNTNKLHTVQRNLSPCFCWWNDASAQCLVYGLEDVKTTKPWPDDTTFLNVIYLYETNSARFTDLTTNFEQLKPDPNSYPSCPSAEDRVWSPDGTWFLVEGGGGWICVPKPWNSIHVGKILGKGVYNFKVAPAGSKIGMMYLENDLATSGDFYVIDVNIGSANTPILGAPRKIASGIPHTWNNWFWSADGKQLLAWNGWNKFVSYPAN